MKTIPKRYLKAENFAEAMLNIRRCLAEGLTVEGMAKDITKRYQKATAEDREALGKYLTAVYDFADSEAAARCAEVFDIEPPRKGKAARTMSYELFKRHISTNPNPWLESFSKEILQWPKSLTPFNAKRYWMAVNPTEKDNVHYMAGCAYWMLGPSFTIHLLEIEDCSLDMLIDEEVFFDGTVPLYFTETTHFTSPVYRIRVVKKILEYCLERVGFPKIEIKLHVLYASPQASFINKDEYEPGGPREKEWEGVNICEFSKMDKRKGFLLRTRPLSKEMLPQVDPQERPLMEQLLNCLNAATKMYWELSYNNKLHQHSHPQLARLAKRLDIFQ